MDDNTALGDAVAIMRDLRKRCEWDAKQTHDSLRPYLIEESHELDDAIRSGDESRMREELGDVLLQVLFHSVIAEERGEFGISDVARALVTKMRARHPHLFDGGDREPWERMKSRKRESIADGLPVGMPSLHRAHRLQDRAAGVGFDWPSVEGPAAKVEEELSEVREHLTGSDSAQTDVKRAKIEAELGDLLFACVNLCRKAGVHPAIALDKANEKFERRFREIERKCRELGLDPAELGLERLDQMWDEAKAAE
ncbi:MAG TPA: nucleoside triphosphate pyrophosphohydrolase [Gemmatimonadaceae bacterium]